MNTVIVYGPQGCGKTACAHTLAQHFGCLVVADGERLPLPPDLVPGTLYLCQQRLASVPDGVLQVSFAAAMAVIRPELQHAA